MEWDLLRHNKKKGNCSDGIKIIWKIIWKIIVRISIFNFVKKAFSINLGDYCLSNFNFENEAFLLYGYVRTLIC